MTPVMKRRLYGAPLTVRQQQVRDYAARYRAMRGAWPSSGQLKRHLKTNSDRYGRETMLALIAMGDLPC